MGSEPNGTDPDSSYGAEAAKESHVVRTACRSRTAAAAAAATAPVHRCTVSLSRCLSPLGIAGRSFVARERAAATRPALITPTPAKIRARSGSAGSCTGINRCAFRSFAMHTCTREPLRAPQTRTTCVSSPVCGRENTDRRPVVTLVRGTAREESLPSCVRLSNRT